MPGKAKKGIKGSKASKDTRRKPRTTPKREKSTPITDEARVFLYECSRGMDENAKRDEFLARAKSEEEDGDLTDTVRHVVRAALFQGQAWGQGNSAMRKKGTKMGLLTSADTVLLRALATSIGEELTGRFDEDGESGRNHVGIILDNIIGARTGFDPADEEPNLWRTHLQDTAGAIVESILDAAKRTIQKSMGEKCWADLGGMHI